METTDKEFLLQIKGYVNTIRSEVSRINDELRENERDYDKTFNRLKAELKKVQERCPHLETKYHPDPSGNNDSSYECKWCGVDV